MRASPITIPKTPQTNHLGVSEVEKISIVPIKHISRFHQNNSCSTKEAKKRF
jgi:hypothetical protein